MTLGRTSSNAIKIKTDTEGGGLRAVGCACCVPLVCGCMYTPNNLISIIESATNVSVNGISLPWDGSSAFYEGSFDYIDEYGNVITYEMTNWGVSYEGGIICAAWDTGEVNSVKLAPEPFTAEACTSNEIVQGFINGQGVRCAAIGPLPLIISSNTFLDIQFS
jgi:hypothetical protein